MIKYLNNVNMPWGKLFYKIVWEQLPVINNKDILDFGSGFGITADHLASNNNVIAYEPNIDMPAMYKHTNHFVQTHKLPNKQFDIIICHNVLEYVSDRAEIINEFYNLLKPHGMLSIVKHNHIGRIMHKAVFDNNVDEASLLLDGGDIYATTFGKINYYNILEFESLFNVRKLMGIRTFFGLQQNNDIKHEPDWQSKMFSLEMKVSQIKEFVDISFFHHILFEKI